MPLFVYGNAVAESYLLSASKAQDIYKLHKAQDIQVAQSTSYLPAGSFFEVVLRLLTLFINV
jgi:hypothetical protein